MRAPIAVLLLSLAGFASCGGSDSFSAQGTIAALGTSKTAVLAADGAMEGDSCQGVGDFDGLSEGGEVVIFDADGTKVGVGELSEGSLTDKNETLSDLGMTSCAWDFSISDIEAGDSDIYTLQVGDFEETFKKSEADFLDISLTKD